MIKKSVTVRSESQNMTIWSCKIRAARSADALSALFERILRRNVRAGPVYSRKPLKYRVIFFSGIGMGEIFSELGKFRWKEATLKNTDPIQHGGHPVADWIELFLRQIWIIIRFASHLFLYWIPDHMGYVRANRLWNFFKTPKVGRASVPVEIRSSCTSDFGRHGGRPYLDFMKFHTGFQGKLLRNCEFRNLGVEGILSI